jgi:hypothetical protein
MACLLLGERYPAADDVGPSRSATARNRTSDQISLDAAAAPTIIKRASIAAMSLQGSDHGSAGPTNSFLIVEA